MLKDDFKIDNPKDVVTKAHRKLKTFHTTLVNTAKESRFSLYPGHVSDVVDGSSLMVLIVSTAVSNIKQVAKIGEHAHEEKIEHEIIFFLTFVLMLIPGFGEVAGLAEIANVARVLRLAGTAGDFAMGTYQVIENPENAATVVFGLLLNGLSTLKAPARFGKAAKAREGNAGRPCQGTWPGGTWWNATGQ